MNFLITHSLELLQVLGTFIFSCHHFSLSHSFQLTSKIIVLVLLFLVLFFLHDFFSALFHFFFSIKQHVLCHFTACMPRSHDSSQRLRPSLVRPASLVILLIPASSCHHPPNKYLPYRFRKRHSLFLHAKKSCHDT